MSWDFYCEESCKYWNKNPQPICEARFSAPSAQIFPARRIMEHEEGHADCPKRWSSSFCSSPRSILTFETWHTAGLAHWESTPALAMPWRKEGVCGATGMLAWGTIFYLIDLASHSLQSCFPRFAFLKCEIWAYFLINWAITLTTGNAGAASQLQDFAN